MSQDFSDPETDSVIVGEEAPCDAENPEDCAADEDEDEEPLPGFPGGIPIVIPGAGGGMTLVMPTYEWETLCFDFGVSCVL